MFWSLQTREQKEDHDRLEEAPPHERNQGLGSVADGAFKDYERTTAKYKRILSKLRQFMILYETKG